MGKSARDDYLKHKKLRVFDFLPEIAYNANGIKVVPRKGTHDYYMFFQGSQWKRFNNTQIEISRQRNILYPLDLEYIWIKVN